MRVKRLRIGQWLLLGSLMACSGGKAGKTSSSSHWYACVASSDCAGIPLASACHEGYCVDDNLERVAAELDGAAPLNSSSTSSSSASVVAGSGGSSSSNGSGATTGSDSSTSGSADGGSGGSSASSTSSDEQSSSSTGSAGAGGDDADGDDESPQGLVLTAVVRPVLSGGVEGLVAEWQNGTDETVFLRGCSTTDAWYLDDGAWQEYGALAACAQETPVVEVMPGATYVDPAGAPPPERGTNVWRLVGPYGVGCTSGQLLSEAQCTEIHEATSVNEVTWQP